MGDGVYTVADAGRILGLNPANTQRWISGYSRVIDSGQRLHKDGIVEAGCWGCGKERAINFYALIELFTFASLRNMGVPAQKIRKARQELSKNFKTAYPFASHRLMSDGHDIIVIFEKLDHSVFMHLGTNGQTALREIIESFYQKIEFCSDSDLALRFWPIGRKRSVVVDPGHAFGRPIITGTNTPTETLMQFIKAGESPENVAQMYNLSLSDIQDAIEFESHQAA